MPYKFLTILSIFFTSFVFALDLPNAGKKRERPEDILNNQPSAKKMATLHKACKKGDMEKVKALLNSDNINEKDGNGNTPILAACAYGRAEVVELLLGEDYIKYININENNENGYSLLQLACKKFKDDKYKKIFKTIINHQHICINYRYGKCDTALMIACVENNLTAIKALLKHPNINVNRTDKRSPTPLHIACKCGNEEIVKLLLKNNKIKINQTTKKFSFTALSIAIASSKPKIVKLLLKEKAINIYEPAKCSPDDVPLIILIRIIKDKKEVNDNTELIIKAFIKYKWEEIGNEDKKELLKKCMEHQKTHLVSLILDKHDKKQKEINDTLLNPDSSKDEQIQNLFNSSNELDDEMQDHSDEIESDFYVNVEDLFISACSNNHKDTLQMLIERYKDNNDNNLYSKLLITASSSYHVDNAELLRILISNNADVNYRESNDGGPSPLHYAVKYANVENTKILIANNANVNCQDNKHSTPLHYALFPGGLELQKILIYNNPDINSLLATKLFGGRYLLDKLLAEWTFYRDKSDKDDLKNLIKYLLEKNAGYSEDNATNALLVKIKTKILAEDTKSVW